MSKFSALSLGGIIGGLITITLIVYVLAAMIPTVNTALTNLTGISGLPFSGLFAANGIIILAILAAVLLGVFAYFGLSSKR